MDKLNRYNPLLLYFRQFSAITLLVFLAKL